MAEYTHGGDIRSAQALHAGPVLDFSANLNPLGMPGEVRRAAEEAVAGCVHYPDPFCRDLTAAIARSCGLAEDRVLCGNGAADLIFRLAFATRPRRALVTAPTFSEYQQALEAAGCAVSHHFLRREDAFALTSALLEELTGELDILFLCDPNNPTGMTVDRPLMEALLERCRELGIRPVVDECFLDLTDGGPGRGLEGLLEAFPRLVLLRAFTKSYAIPGLRLGHCLTADGELREALLRCAQPWSVSAPAQAAGLAALACPEHPARARALIAAERPRLAEALSALGLEVFPSRANYLLFHAPGRPRLREALLERGVLIRSCANYPGLLPEDYRVAVRLPQENQVLIRALQEVL